MSLAALFHLPRNAWRRQRARAQAAGWVTRIDVGLTEAQRRAFEAWSTHSLNTREFHELRAILDVATELKGPPRAQVLASVADEEPPLHERLTAGSLWLSGVAVAAVLSAVAAGGLMLRGEGYLPRSYQTRIGQSRSVVFPDGSIAYLNTQTELRWVGSPDDRRVRLIRGEALFEVVHDPSRPFRILLAHSQVQVLGTRFDVYQKVNGSVVVTVLSGTVSVQGLDNGGGELPSWSRRLTANQQIEYSPLGLMADVHSTVAPRAVRWREGMVETQGEPLSDFVSDLSRYTAERIVIADPRAASEQIGGAFSVRDVDATLDRLTRIAPLTVAHEDGEVILGFRSAAAQDRPGRASPP